MNKLQLFIADKPFGFLKDTDMPALIEMDRLMPCLVRCERCRFTCAAQDVAHLLKCVRAGGDHVRDVSMAHGYKERAAAWHAPHVARPKPSPDLALATEANLKSPWKTRAPEMPWHSDDLMGSEEAVERHYNQPRSEREFNEADCGGVWTGSEVISDADPSL